MMRENSGRPASRRVLPPACVCFADELACRCVQTVDRVVMHVPRPFRTGGMTCGIELRGNLPRFQTASVVAFHRTSSNRTWAAANVRSISSGKRAHTAFLRRGNRQELFDRILLFGFHRRRETPNKRFAQRISLRHAGRIGSGSNQGLDLGDRQRGRRLLLTLLLGFGANLFCLQNGSFKRFIDLDGEFAGT